MEEDSEERSREMWSEGRVTTLVALETEGGDHEPRNVGRVLARERESKQVLPRSLWKDCSPADTLLDFSPVRLLSDF